jgi:hypothetical protein
MDKTFNTAMEARDIISDLRIQLKRLPYNPDLMKLCNNIGEMNTTLSRLEVEARQTRKTYKFDAYKEDMAKAIKHLEHLILMAKLMA